MFITPEGLDQALLNVHVAVIGKILSTDGDSAKVQPLTMLRTRDGKSETPAVLPTVPICKNIHHVEIRRMSIEGVSFDLPVLTKPRAGDVVLCVCTDRDSTESRKGSFGTPTEGHHSLSDAFIVGLLSS